LGAPADFPIHPFNRYGLALVEETVPQLDLHAPSERSTPLRAPGSLRWFDWGMLTGFAVLELSYLAGLAVFARWAVRHMIGA